MSQYGAAVIGTGPEPDNIVWGESASMAYNHGDAYRSLPDTDLVACADIVRENAEAFADEFDLDDGNVFEDFEEMLYTVEPEVVSVCTPVPTHGDIVVGAIETGVPEAIHCEKPMADTWEDCQRMAAAADEADVQLTFNHQRRFNPGRRRAGELVDEGLIGDLRRVEVGRSNLFDYGTHLIDLANRYNGEHDAEWVLGQIHYEDENVRYGVHNENQAVATWRYENGVHGFASTGAETGNEVIGCANRLIGTGGTIEVQPDPVDADLRYRTDDTDGWVEEHHDSDRADITLAIEHVVDALSENETPEISAEKALRASEIIFGAWESARRRRRVEFPLEAPGNALTEMVESGDLSPE